MNALTIDFTKEPHQIKDDILSLPLKEQDYWIALWISQPNILNDMRFRQLPVRPSKFAKESEIKSYQITKGTIISQNYRNLKELKWAKEILINNLVVRKKIENRINEFIDIEEHPEPINMEREDKNWQD